MTAKKAVFTSFSFSYLDRALVLLESFRTYNQGYDFIAVICDLPPPDLPLGALAGFDAVLYAKDLYGEGHEPWFFTHNVVELCTAVKALALQALLAKGYSLVLYLDPDIAVFAPLTKAEERLEEYHLVLTPHQLSYDHNPVSVQDNEIGSLKYGIYNLGFLAVRNQTVGQEFAEWWGRRLHDHCFEDVPNGIFTDQRWIDHVPVFFDGVHILKDAGYNVASWNLSRRTLSLQKDVLYSNQDPLVFFHFTKFNGVGSAMISRYARENFLVYELWEYYRRLLEKYQEFAFRNYWYYGEYSNGEKIEPEHRRLYRSRKMMPINFPNPFQAGVNSFHDFVKRTPS